MVIRRFRHHIETHNWFAVAIDLIVVVVGVLIALGAQQIVQDLHDRSVAAETRREIVNEINSNLMSIALRESTEACVRHRLDELRAIVAEWERTGSFRTPKWVGQSTVIRVELSRYDAALAAGRLALLSGEEQYRIGVVVGRIREFNQRQFDERLPWGRLRSLQFGPEALSDEDRAAIRTALQDASTLDYELRTIAAQTLPMARKFGFHPDPKGFREMAPQVWPGGKFTPFICASIDTPPEEANKRAIVPLAL